MTRLRLPIGLRTWGWVIRAALRLAVRLYRQRPRQARSRFR
jgi:hypothetical protein